MYDLTDTIAAIASASGGAARAIVRISGPRAMALLEPLVAAEEPSRRPQLQRSTAWDSRLTLPGLHSPLPARLYAWPDERSYTREPVLEIHTLGSPPLVQWLLRTLCAAGARLAEPGEFTLRAFLAGRLDLTQAEAVLGVIDSRHSREFELALQQLAGGLSAPLACLRDSLLDLLAHLEAGLDFADEDIGFITAVDLEMQLGKAAQQIQGLVSRMDARLDASDRTRLVLSGAPNVGKSSLFNALLRREQALVSPLAGTTRDYLTADMHIGGVACQLIDTAGQRDDSATGIDAAAQASSRDQQSAAQIELFCIDATRPLNAWERSALDRQPPGVRIVVQTKTDQFKHGAPSPVNAIATSSVTGQGLDRLLQQIAQNLGQGLGESSMVASTALRCRESLHWAGQSLQRARELAAGQASHELISAETRVALTELGKVVGAIYTDDLLDRIFSRFCIGK